jgi:hypothetical protein
MECPSRLVDDKLEAVESALRAFADGVLVDTALAALLIVPGASAGTIGVAGDESTDLRLLNDLLLGLRPEDGKVMVATDEAIEARGDVFGVKNISTSESESSSGSRIFEDGLREWFNT